MCMIETAKCKNCSEISIITCSSGNLCIIALKVNYKVKNVLYGLSGEFFTICTNMAKMVLKLSNSHRWMLSENVSLFSKFGI